MIAPKFYGTIKDGKIEHQNPELFQNYVTFNFKDDQEVEIVVKKRAKRRTAGLPGEETNFNGYYWTVIVRTIADHIGEMDQDIVHQWIQTAVGHTKAMPDGTKVPIGTSHLSGGEFSEYCKRVRMWAGNSENALGGLFLPQPHEVEYP